MKNGRRGPKWMNLFYFGLTQAFLGLCGLCGYFVSSRS